MASLESAGRYHTGIGIPVRFRLLVGLGRGASLGIGAVVRAGLPDRSDTRAIPEIASVS